MPSIEDIYRKFGEASEAAQLLETELGTLLFINHVIDSGIISLSDSGIEIDENPDRAERILEKINRKTLGQLINNLKTNAPSLEVLEALLVDALKERNRLLHSFYRAHNLRRNSDEGRIIMLKDLEGIHDIILQAYKAVLSLSGVDVDELEKATYYLLPTEHLPI